MSSSTGRQKAHSDDESEQITAVADESTASEQPLDRDELVALPWTGLEYKRMPSDPHSLRQERPKGPSH